MVATAGTPRARALSAALRDARETRGVGLRVLARQLEISHTQISHWETGHRVPGVEVVAMILAALRVSPGERERILDLARNLGEPSWLTVGISGIPQQLAGAIECERAASAIVEWSPMVVPGLLQIRDYSRAILEKVDLPAADFDTRVLVRAGRGDVLLRHDPPRFEALISEAVVHEPVGSAHVMQAQLAHLVVMAAKSNVTIRVVPLRVGWHPGWSGPFVVYEFPAAPAVVHFEHYSSGAFVPVEHDVKEYRTASQRIRDVALGAADSLDYLAKALREWEVRP
ncbi:MULTISPECIES: helix-turn-helix transcriptional regulator [unclassified Saccharopolyspora]|uniref:helix-turn-helix domain-containing protein n=1 Tax=unclassified Saccharopolyspora TaxID=2646250 RepID=UPI001CD78318|nr:MULTISPECIES: helix-turn-helix transcriptional regulator [unclassified Saccharopolyspora]MCA1189790.1 helix-turn-helix transcriptional regulator [Saccharopolyspora sp. 6T]MCA1194860.1 helix-turn-helix transcriptional regulator [Saccharopolyspora sp. 6V]MCA1229684.1 helix-turn-helix transcriptional regulator [Saccharopolyspora sp. 6M]MCA1283160.1 helix-turn-helix transcriptional regulator [Saccharopolyspora sp. 7B]